MRNRTKSKCKYFPSRKTCRWCDYSLAPELYDGGCMIKEGERPGDEELERRWWELERKRHQQHTS